MASFTDQKQRIATKEDCESVLWSGAPNGERFRCALCGHKFSPGDKWRWVYMNDLPKSYGNIMVCDNCDHGNVRDKWVEKCEQWEKFKIEFWYFN